MADKGGGARHQTAVALAYQGGDGAPKVVAKGKGLVAEQIIQRAGDAGVFVHESKELVALLMQIDLDRQIPPALYRAIAELLAWLYHIESGQISGGTRPAPPDTARLIDTQENSGIKHA
ncbi:EscU/YscU/HrcU family type III secretion system export apparatus switch protein [Massilia cavernae]|uniref:Flagellar biosynthetic protein FlhB n=1 Tax=Massilia cavernae TaxID=2320864 RepID=A0A418XSM7_9BURK|nr:EscU/YscU/HrcU family type III secretion system export apparatus switch protein [Massilia cavernae]RJG15589.1 flagellar biosynthetic protein FlhB [Massilia cavernae]